MCIRDRSCSSACQPFSVMITADGGISQTDYCPLITCQCGFYHDGALHTLSLIHISFKNSYKDKKKKRADKEDWVVFDDTQEPLSLIHIYSRYLTSDMAETASCVIHLAAKLPPFDGCTNFFPLVEAMISDKDVSDHHAIIPTMEPTVTNQGQLKSAL